MAPVGRVRDDRVDVAEQPERGPVGAPAQAPDDVRSLGVLADDRHLEARRAQEPGHVVLRGALVAGRVDGVEADQAPEHLDRLALERAAHGRDPTCSLAAVTRPPGVEDLAQQVAIGQVALATRTASSSPTRVAPSSRAATASRCGRSRGATVRPAR